MHKVLAVLAVAVLVHGPAAVVAQDAGSAEHTAVLAKVHQFVDGFNQGDAGTALAACAEETSILDEFPPHEWHGPGACEHWMNDYIANAKQYDITDGIVTLGTPRHVDITGDRAYVVIPSDYTWVQQGKPMKETASMFSFALRKGPDGWRIVGWSWARS